MDVTETDLPGVGKKHEIELRSGVRAVVLTQNTGDRELLCKHETDVDPERLLELTDGKSGSSERSTCSSTLPSGGCSVTLSSVRCFPPS